MPCDVPLKQLPMKAGSVPEQKANCFFLAIAASCNGCGLLGCGLRGDLGLLCASLFLRHSDYPMFERRIVPEQAVGRNRTLGESPAKRARRRDRRTVDTNGHPRRVPARRSTSSLSSRNGRSTPPTLTKRPTWLLSGGPLRGGLGRTNLAHAYAAAPSHDTLVLRELLRPSLVIVTACNDMLSAYQPCERYPARIKKAPRAAEATAQVAGGVPAMCDGVTQGEPGIGLALQPGCDGAGHRGRVIAQHVRRRFVLLAPRNVACVGGSSLKRPETAATGGWRHIEKLSREAAGLRRSPYERPAEADLDAARSVARAGSE